MAVRVCFPFVGDSVGGAHISTLLLARALNRQLFVPSIVLHQTGPLSDYLDQRHTPYRVVPITRFAGSVPRLTDIGRGMLGACSELKSFFSEDRPDIVHANDLRMNLTWALPARLNGAVFIWHQRTLPRSNSRLWQLVPKMASACVAISKVVAEAMRFPPGSVIYNPFDIPTSSATRSEARERMLRALGAPSDTILLGFVGRLIAEKRPDVVVEIVSSLNGRGGSPARCVLVGRGNAQDVAALEALAEARGVKQQVHLLGFRDDVDEIVRGLDILLAPSAFEGFGRTVVEAMMLGTPVIASDIAPHREILETCPGGLISPLGDVQGWADRVMQLAGNRQLAAQLQSRGSSLAREMFSTETHVAKVEALYERLLHAHSLPRAS